MQRAKPTLFVVDDDQAVLDAMATMARTVGLNVEVYSSAEDFLRGFVDCPGCLLLDIRMPYMNGLDLQELLPQRGINLPVIIVTGHAEVQLAVRAVKLGAVDFLEKPFREQELLDRIHAAFELDTERRIQRSRHQEFSERFDSLTPREHDVMQLMVEGYGGKQIATELGVSYKTIEKFRSKVLRKMAASSIAELVLMAVSLKLVVPGQSTKSSSRQKKVSA